MAKPAREVLELLYGERAVVRLVARPAGEVAGAPIPVIVKLIWPCAR